MVSPYGDPVVGGVVSFAVPSSGPSATVNAYTATIDSSGQAQVMAKANGTTGQYSVTASASGGTTSAVFSLGNYNQQVVITPLVALRRTLPWGAQTSMC